jgi:hypothetical protein
MRNAIQPDRMQFFFQASSATTLADSARGHAVIYNRRATVILQIPLPVALIRFAEVRPRFDQTATH